MHSTIIKSTCGKLAALAVVAATALMPSRADTYQFIISGDPIAAATVDSCAVASSATALATGTYSASTAATSLEARYRTWDESDGITLRSDKCRGFMLFIR